MKKILLVFFAASLTSSIFAASKNEKSRFEKLELFNKVLNLIENQYYREVDTEKLIHGAIKGMMETLDPHSAFLNKEFFSKMQEDTKGEFGGLGLEVTQKDGVLVVITPIDDTPAFRAGIKPGDKIVEINHESTIGLTLDEAVEKMKGKPRSIVNVGIARDGVEGIQYFKIKRETIKIKSVKSDLISKNFIFVRLSSFQKGAGNEIASAIRKLSSRAKKNGGVKGIILDLRFNGGGLLDEAVNVSSIFLKSGIVVSSEARDPKDKEFRYVKKTGYKDLETPLVVLINGASASASEIVAGALQDSKRALVMGTNSFGKGSIQTVTPLDDENGIKITIAQYMTPKGTKIQAIGIRPDVVLDDIDNDLFLKSRKDSNYIREIDLRNHLTATFETKEEEKVRLKREKEERIKRVQRIKDQSKKKDSKQDEMVKFDPKKDYQVLQAIRFLKSFKIYKSMLSK